MQTTILDLAKGDLCINNADTKLSFAPFLRFLKSKKLYTNEIRNGYLSYVIDQFELQPELLEQVNIDEVKNYAPQLQLIYNTLCPIVEDEETHYWALSMPLQPTLFYSTNAFFNLIGDLATIQQRRRDNMVQNVSDFKADKLKFAYSLILEKIYNIPSFFDREIVESMVDEKTGQIKFYRLKMDTRFIDIHPTREIPEINIEALKSRSSYDHHDVLPLLQRILPLELFRFEGFGITNITDITATYAMENIRNTILNFSNSKEEQCFKDINSSLKALVSDNEIKFGVLPVLMINDKLVFDKAIFANSMLMNVSGEVGLAESTYLELAKKYFDDPKTIIYKSITEQDESRRDYLRLLKKAGVNSYALLPIYSNKILTGVLEVYSAIGDRVNETLLSALDPAMPLLAQLLTNGIHQFEEEIEQVIKDKFTSLQPAVQWKFNEAAWHFIRDKHVDGNAAEIEDIDFKNVYPLYGAIDIRNSTLNRNASLSKDLVVQFTVLISVLKELKERSGFGLIDEKLFLSKKWLDEVSDPQGFSRQIELDQFLENNIVPFLHDFKKGNPVYEPIISKYFSAIDPRTGIASESRRQLEEAMTAVISSVNFYLESMKAEIQNAYPCYFEKFRTDGIEYDIYIGQQIAPDNPFSEIYLKNLRLMQLTSMAAIAKYTHALMSTLSKPIETTQLVFVHSNQIDIKFRKDEKRFDVEGAYNIRYHIVKKRIDKALIKGTDERLTQPDKIAIVYFTQQEAIEYKGYISYLQQQDILTEEVEDLDLEEMQGVNGLKALRVGVKI